MRRFIATTLAAAALIFGIAASAPTAQAHPRQTSAPHAASAHLYGGFEWIT